MAVSESVEATTLRLGCGADTRRAHHNVDIEPLDGVDEVVDLNETPWPWPDSSFRGIVAEHVFEHLDDMEATLRECARVLEPGGRLYVVLPMGVNAVADPDHNHEWTWQTPLCYCGERHWDTDVGLEVVKRSVDMHSLYGSSWLNRLQRFKWWLAMRHDPGEWCFRQPAMSGEFEVVFEA